VTLTFKEMEMKAIFAMLSVVGALVLAPSVGFAHDKHGQPQFGGIFAEAGAFQLELVLTGKAATLHVSDHGKPVEVKGGSAKLTLLAGTAKSEVNLTPAGSKFEATGSFPAAKGTKAVAVVTLAGKAPVTARFTMK
jgi:hypothetical protein